MSSVVWILFFLSSGHRPAVIVDRFATEADCRAALAAVKAADDYQAAKCFPAKVVRP